MPSSELLTIGRIADLSGVSIDTIRFYESEGLLKPARRTAAGYRQYREDAAQRLKFISRAKELGFSLREIGELLSLRIRSSKTCSSVQKKAEKKLEEIETKISDLEAMKGAVKDLIRSCKQNEKLECPLISALHGD